MAVTVRKQELAKALYLKGLPMSRIAEQLGAQASTVRQWASRGEWNKLEHATAKAVVTAQDLDAKAVAQTFVADLVAESRRLFDRLRTAKPRKVRDIRDAVSALAGLSATARRNLGLDDAQAAIHLHVYNANKRQSVNVIDVVPEIVNATAASTEIVSETAPTADNAS